MGWVWLLWSKRSKVGQGYLECGQLLEHIFKRARKPQQFWKQPFEVLESKNLSPSGIVKNWRIYAKKNCQVCKLHELCPFPLCFFIQDWRLNRCLRWFFSQRGRPNAQLHRPSTQVTSRIYHCWTKQVFEDFWGLRLAWCTLRSNNQHSSGSWEDYFTSNIILWLLIPGCKTTLEWVWKLLGHLL